jgi:hypothetical protein
MRQFEMHPILCALCVKTTNNLKNDNLEYTRYMKVSAVVILLFIRQRTHKRFKTASVKTAI